MRLEKVAFRVLLIASIAGTACTGGSEQSDIGEETQALSVHSHAQLARWFEQASPEVLAVPGTVLAYQDAATGRLVFGVEHAAVTQGVRTALAHLGIPNTAFSVVETAPIYQLATLRDRWRPTVAGVQIHFGNFLCSLGFNADDGTQRSLITASHCTNTQGGVESTQYFQPTSTVDPTVIATEVEDPTYFKGGACPRGRKCRFSDSSRAVYSAAVTSSRGSIAKTSAPNNGSLDVTGNFTVTSQDDTTTRFAVGTMVNKVGRTTGWTQGNVTQSCVNVNVSGSQITQLCQTLVQNPNGAVVVQGGDSGSGVFTITSGTNVRLVGILWGGNSAGTQFVFSPLKQVEDELGHLTTF
jgi:hypothetical protein